MYLITGGETESAGPRDHRPGSATHPKHLLLFCSETKSRVRRHVELPVFKIRPIIKGDGCALNPRRCCFTASGDDKMFSPLCDLSCGFNLLTPWSNPRLFTKIELRGVHRVLEHVCFVTECARACVRASVCVRACVCERELVKHRERRRRVWKVLCNSWRLCG